MRQTTKTRQIAANAADGRKAQADYSFVTPNGELDAETWADLQGTVHYVLSNGEQVSALCGSQSEAYPSDTKVTCHKCILITTTIWGQA